VFTGKLPNETGIPGNEFFARDLPFSEPARFANPPGMIAFDSGAFPGFDAFPKIAMLLDDDFFVPSRHLWTNGVNPLNTPQNSTSVLKADTIYEIIGGRPAGFGMPELPGIAPVTSRFRERGGDVSVVANNHYARGARWLTWNLDLRSGLDYLLDQQSWARFQEYLNERYADMSGKRNTVSSSTTGKSTTASRRRMIRIFLRTTCPKITAPASRQS
jgi:hypothetical protein